VAFSTKKDIKNGQRRRAAEKGTGSREGSETAVLLQKKAEGREKRLASTNVIGRYRVTLLLLRERHQAKTEGKVVTNARGNPDGGESERKKTDVQYLTTVDWHLMGKNPQI